MDGDTKILPTVEVGDMRAERVVIWLHGLGADGHDFEPVVPYLGLAPERRVRFVFPTAPRIPVSINGGMRMPAWYDIRELGLEKDHDETGIRRSAAHVEALIARERSRGIPSSQIALAGFSQGGALAIHVALRHPEPLAGLVALSCYLVLGAALPAERHDANRGLVVFQAHGTHDPMVPLARGEAACATLRGLGHEVRWQTWPMAHEVCLEEIRAIGAYLDGRLA